MSIRNKFLVALTAVALGVSASPALEESFANPSDEARPWSFWYWMFGAVTEDGIKADLQAMKDVGLGGTYLMPIKSVEMAPEYEGKAPQLSPEWWRLVGRSMEIADSLGLKLGMHICDGFALAGGPWIEPEEAMQKVVIADTVISGGKVSGLKLPVPETIVDYYKDIAIYAVPVKGHEIGKPVKVTSANTVTDFPAGKGVTVDSAGVIRSSVPCWVQYEYAEPVTVRSLEVVRKGNSYQSNRLTVMASDDGETFREVKKLVPARHGWQNYDENNTHSLPETTARYFRFYWTPEGSEPGSEDLDNAKWKPGLRIDGLNLSSEPKINHWEGKSGRVWRVAPATDPAEVTPEMAIGLDEIIDLSASVTDGRLTASLPDGEWRILRLGSTPNGHTNATVVPERVLRPTSSVFMQCPSSLTTGMAVCSGRLIPSLQAVCSSICTWTAGNAEARTGVTTSPLNSRAAADMTSCLIFRCSPAFRLSMPPRLRKSSVTCVRQWPSLLSMCFTPSLPTRLMNMVCSSLPSVSLPLW